MMTFLSAIFGPILFGYLACLGLAVGAAVLRAGVFGEIPNERSASQPWKVVFLLLIRPLNVGGFWILGLPIYVALFSLAKN